jgi:hypothetical protein
MGLKRVIFSIAISFVLSISAQAQIMEVGLNVGAAGYMGDLNQNNPAALSGLSFGAYVKGNLDPYWALGVHYNYGKVKANDQNSSNADFRDRNLNFASSLHELSLQVDFNFLEYFSGGGTKNFTPYIFTGIGGVLFDPKATYQDQEYQLRYYETEGKSYKNYALSIPYGVGVKYRIAERLALVGQVGYRTAHTDYIDDVGDVYPLINVYGKVDADHPQLINLSDPSLLNRTVQPGSQRGDYNKRDTYFFVHIGLSYTFTSDKCFSF